MKAALGFAAFFGFWLVLDRVVAGLVAAYFGVAS